MTRLAQETFLSFGFPTPPSLWPPRLRTVRDCLAISKVFRTLPAVLLSVSSFQADAADLAFLCPEADGLAEVTLLYQGDESGTLTVAGGLGGVTLPATKTEREAVFDGDTIKSVGIRGRGPATVPMPDKGKLEACLVAKGATPDDPDAFAYQVNLCRLEVAAAAPVAVDVEITVTAIDSPDAEVFVRRTYAEESALAGGPITIDLFPLLTCAAQP